MAPASIRLLCSRLLLCAAVMATPLGAEEEDKSSSPVASLTGAQLDGLAAAQRDPLKEVRQLAERWAGKQLAARGLPLEFPLPEPAAKEPEPKEPHAVSYKDEIAQDILRCLSTRHAVHEYDLTSFAPRFTKDFTPYRDLIWRVFREAPKHRRLEAAWVLLRQGEKVPFSDLEPLLSTSLDRTHLELAVNGFLPPEVAYSICLRFWSESPERGRPPADDVVWDALRLVIKTNRPESWTLLFKLLAAGVSDWTNAIIRELIQLKPEERCLSLEDLLPLLVDTIDWSAADKVGQLILHLGKHQVHQAADRIAAFLNHPFLAGDAVQALGMLKARPFAARLRRMVDDAEAALPLRCMAVISLAQMEEIPAEDAYLKVFALVDAVPGNHQIQSHIQAVQEMREREQAYDFRPPAFSSQPLPGLRFRCYTTQEVQVRMLAMLAGSGLRGDVEAWLRRLDALDFTPKTSFELLGYWDRQGMNVSAYFLGAVRSQCASRDPSVQRGAALFFAVIQPAGSMNALRTVLREPASPAAVELAAAGLKSIDHGAFMRELPTYLASGSPELTRSVLLKSGYAERLRGSAGSWTGESLFEESWLLTWIHSKDSGTAVENTAGMWLPAITSRCVAKAWRLTAKLSRPELRERLTKLGLSKKFSLSGLGDLLWQQGQRRSPRFTAVLHWLISCRADVEGWPILEEAEAGRLPWRKAFEILNGETRYTHFRHSSGALDVQIPYPFERAVASMFDDTRSATVEERYDALRFAHTLNSVRLGELYARLLADPDSDIQWQAAANILDLEAKARPEWLLAIIRGNNEWYASEAMDLMVEHHLKGDGLPRLPADIRTGLLSALALMNHPQHRVITRILLQQTNPPSQALTILLNAARVEPHTPTKANYLSIAYAVYGHQPVTRTVLPWLGGRAEDERPALPTESGTAETLVAALLQMADVAKAQSAPALQDECLHMAVQVSAAAPWETAQLPVLGDLAGKLKENASGPAGLETIQSLVAAVESRQPLRRALRAAGWVALLQPSFWVLVLLVYPWWQPAQRLVWSRPLRRWLGLGWVEPLLLRSAWLRDRLWRPFREATVPPEEAVVFDEWTFFDGVYVEAAGRRLPALTTLRHWCGIHVVTGASGLGKTTLLHALAATTERPVAFLRAVECGQGIAAALAARLPVPADAEFVRALLQRGSPAVLVDAVQEATAPTVKALTHSLALPGLSVLLSTQPGWEPPPGAAVWNLEPLRPEDRRDFLLKQGTAAVQSTGAASPAAQLRAFTEHVDAFLSRVAALPVESDAARTHDAMLRNPMEAVLAAELLAAGQVPDPARLMEQRLEHLVNNCEAETGQPFPAAAVAACIEAAKQNGAALLTFASLPGTAAYLAKHRVLRADPHRDGWRFRHDKIMNWFHARGASRAA